MRWTLPNILTTFRLTAAPALALSYLVFPRPAADWVALVLFLGASLTDYFDGALARAWKQTTKMGTMLDPIADKAMVVIALMVLGVYSTMAVWLVLPAAIILFREVFVSGLREFLGDVAGTLKVTKLAKWKTATQMVAIAVIFLHGIAQQEMAVAAGALDPRAAQAVLEGRTPDHTGLGWRAQAVQWTGHGGLVLIWIAAALTAITGADYFRKARNHLRD